MSMTKHDLFAMALNRALPKAEAIAKSTEDTGTCNTDSVLVYIRRANTAGMEHIGEKCGVRITRIDHCLFRLGKRWGMAYRNTRANEALCQALRDEGVESFMEYRMD